MIILIGGVKGGSGKSTIATNLAVAYAQFHDNILLVDTDKQKTSFNWHQRRLEAGLNDENSISCEIQTGKVIEAIRDKSKHFKNIVIDAGGFDSVELRSAMVVADVIVSPVRPSQADLESFSSMEEIVDAAGAFRETEPRKIALITMCPTHHLVTEKEEARDYLEAYSSFNISSHVVHDRKVYRDAMYEGKGVLEMSNTSSAFEIASLYKEINN